MQERFNRYSLSREIASKPSGSAYLAHDINHPSQKVALKVFKISEQQGQNLLQKVEEIRQLGHSSIVPTLDLGIEGGYFYVAREYLASNSLRQHLDSLSPKHLDLQEACKIVSRIGQAVSYAHQHKVIHGNLKPENIFLNEDGKVLLTDFGLACFTNATKLGNKSYQQTTNLAPEQLAGTTTEKSDQYALACLAYELITGCAPFSPQSFYAVVPPISVPRESAKAFERRESENKDLAGLMQIESTCENSQCPDYGKVENGNIRKFGKTRRGVQRWQCKTCQTTWSSSSTSVKYPTQPIPLSDLIPDLPEPIEDVIHKAMAKDPSERYATVAIFLRTLQVALLLSTHKSTDSPPAYPIALQPMSGVKTLEKRESETLATTHLREHWNHVQNDYHASKVSPIPNSDRYHASRSAAALPNSDTHRASNSITTLPNSDPYRNVTKPVTKPRIEIFRAKKDLTEAFPEGKRPQISKPLPPTLWLAFALSGIALLLGTMSLYFFVPPQSPASNKLAKSSPQPQPTESNTPIVHLGQASTPPVTVNTLTEVEPSVFNNCNGAGWTRPANNANDDYPNNAYYLAILNGNASCYTANWTIPVSSTTGKTCDFITVFTKNTNAQVIYTFTDKNRQKFYINVNIASPAWTTFSSLKDITSIELTAQDNGQSGTTMSAGPFTINNCH
jgi:serine/threonine protein kinase